MWEFLGGNWLWILLVAGMLWMHLGHGGHGGHGGSGGHGGQGGQGGHGGRGGHQHSGTDESGVRADHRTDLGAKPPPDRGP